MPLSKQVVTFNFSNGIDTLTDSNQLPLGRFVSLTNSRFTQADGYGKLDKRFGFNAIASFSQAQYLSTFKGNLLGIGNSIYAYSNSVTANVGYYQPLQLSTLSLNRNFYSPVYVDSARADNGFICYAYQNSLAATVGYYVSVVDGSSGQPIMAPTQITNSIAIQPMSNQETRPPRVFSLNNKFVVAFDGTVGTTSALQYFTIDQSSLTLSSVSTVTNNYRVSSSSFQISFDGQVANNSLYLAWSGSSSQILATTINSAFQVGASSVIGTGFADMVSVCVDTSTATTMFASWVPNYTTQTAKIVATDANFVTRWSAQTVTSSGGSGIVNVTAVSLGGVCNTYLEKAKNYTYNTAQNNQINTFSTTVQGSVSSEVTAVKGVGLASKAFVMSSQSCFLSMYNSAYQATYFLHAATYQQNFVIPGNLRAVVNVVGKLAYGNAYASTTAFSPCIGLASVSVIGSSAQVSYLQTTTITPLNKSSSGAPTSQAAAIFNGSGGINVSTWNFGGSNIQTSEIESNLHLNGGYLWMYDGTTPVEHNFLVYPDNVQVTTTGSGASGSVAPQAYYYQAIYQWQDSQANIHRSAPSLPVGVAVGSSNSVNTLNIPTLRLTQRNTTNPVVVSIFRWSTAQQVYYKIGPSIVLDASALLNDSIPVGDSKSDAQIIGNEILYTNGNVLEDSGSPACTGLALFDSRLWLIDAEDDNLLWYAKPGVESAPVEMSNLQTYFVPPTVSGVSIPGGLKCIFTMDDKLILFKKNAILYINGAGPDSTGANSQYSTPILITNGVGCSNPNSLVLIPQGIMFQSDKGIWILKRDLSIEYLGKEAEAFNTCEVRSAISVPGTNEARFTLGSSNQTLVYDYFANQWDQLTGVPAAGATIYGNQHTSIASTGFVSQQSNIGFADNGVPTTMSWTTGWVNLASLQGYVRAYRMYLLGKFQSPHTYSIGIAYDYNPQVVQTDVINPTNSVGSGSFVEQWQVNFENQQCQSFQLTFQETASSSAGAGLSLSGVKLVYGSDKGYPGNIGVKNKIG